MAKKSKINLRYSIELRKFYQMVFWKAPALYNTNKFESCQNNIPTGVNNLHKTKYPR
jgi:hypothetical protein